MAARAPTTFVIIDESAIARGEPIVATTLDAVFDNQEWLVDQPQVVIADAFTPIVATSITWASVARYYIHAKDACGLNSTLTATVYARVWSDSVATVGIGVSSTADATGTPDRHTTRAPSATPAWVQVTAALAVATDGTEELIEVYLRNDPGGAAGSVFVAGLLLFVNAP